MLTGIFSKVHYCEHIIFFPSITSEVNFISDKPCVAVEGQCVPNVAARMPRANVAKYMLDRIETDENSGKCVAVGLVA